MKRGPKTTTSNAHAAQYQLEGYPLGLTVAEYEARRGWPRFTIAPEAEHACGPNDLGWWMYRNANEDERQAMKLETVPRRSRKPKRAA